MMKKLLKVGLIAFVAIFATGCANQAAQDYYLAMSAAANANAAQAEHRYKALATVAANATANGDQSAAVAATMAIAMTRDTVITPQYVESSALKWASIIVPSVANLGGLAIQANVAKNASDNAKDIQLATQTTNQAIHAGNQAMVGTIIQGNNASALNTTDALVTLGTAGLDAVNLAGQQTVELGTSGLNTIETLSEGSNTLTNNLIDGSNALTNNLSEINAGTTNNLIGVIETQILNPVNSTDTIICSPNFEGVIVCESSSD